MAEPLKGLRVAILVTDGFEQVEMTSPREAVEKAGGKAELIAPGKQEVQGMEHDEKGKKFRVDVLLREASASNYDALILPGGVANPDKLRMMPEAVQFVQSFAAADKPIAAICHGPWMLVEAGLVKGRTVTSWPSLKTDIRNAGGQWEDREVVAEKGLVTSRKPDDLPAFNREMVKMFAKAGEGGKTLTAGS